MGSEHEGLFRASNPIAAVLVIIVLLLILFGTNLPTGDKK